MHSFHWSLLTLPYFFLYVLVLYVDVCLHSCIYMRSYVNVHAVLRDHLYLLQLHSHLFFKAGFLIEPAPHEVNLLSFTQGFLNRFF